MLVAVDQPASVGALPLAVARDMGCPVAYLPGLTMRRIADLYPGEAKTGAKDAFIIADAARAMSHTLRAIDSEEETTAELEMIVGFDDDLAGEATRIANRPHGLLTHIHPSLERVVGPRFQHPAVLTLLQRFGSPTQIRKAGRRRLVTLLRPQALRMAERLVDELFVALDEQTVTVPGTEAAALIVPSLAASLTAVLDQRTLLAGRIEKLLEAHPSFEGPDVDAGSRRQGRSPHPDRSRRRQHLPDRRPPRRLCGSRPGDPELGLLDPRRTTVPEGTSSSNGPSSSRRSPPSAIRHRGPTTTRRSRRASITPRPCSALPDVGPTSCSPCSATAPSANPRHQPQSPDQRLCEEHDSISLDIEAQHRMAITALRIHQHRLTQPPSDLLKEAAEHIKSLLPLQLPDIDIEIDFIISMETEDRQATSSGPDPQVPANRLSGADRRRVET